MKLTFEGSMTEFRALCASVAGSSVYTFTTEGIDALATEAENQAQQAEEMVAPKPVNPALAQLPHISPEKRLAALQAFTEFCLAWTENFEQEGEQPDRVKLMTSFGGGPHTLPVIVMAYEQGSLQSLVLGALTTAAPDTGSYDEWLDYVDRVASTMVQVSHIGWPELAGTYDYTTKWRRG